LGTTTSKHIALFIPTMYGGGAERVMLNLATVFADRGHRIDLVLTRADGVFLKKVPNNVRIVDLKASRIVRSLIPLVRYLKNEKPQVILSALKPANLIAIWAKSIAGSQARLVISEHSTLSRATANPTFQRERIMPFLMRRSYPKADAVVAVSSGVADDLSDMIDLPRDRIEVIHNPIVSPGMLEQSNLPLNHPWFGKDEPPVILAVGRLIPAKDFPTLIRAFSIVLKQTNARLLILGEGKDRPKLEALIGDLELNDTVSLPGFADNPYQYMRHADVFVLSSAWEGFCNVLIEALACGTSVISTDCKSGPRELLKDGRHGVLVDVGDVNALANALVKHFSSHQTYEDIEVAQYSIPTIAEMYEEVLQTSQ